MSGTMLVSAALNLRGEESWHSRTSCTAAFAHMCLHAEHRRDCPEGSGFQSGSKYNFGASGS